MGPSIVHDLLATMHRVATGQEAAPELVGHGAPPPLVVTAARTGSGAGAITASDVGAVSVVGAGDSPSLDAPPVHGTAATTNGTASATATSDCAVTPSAPVRPSTPPSTGAVAPFASPTTEAAMTAAGISLTAGTGAAPSSPSPLLTRTVSDILRSDTAPGVRMRGRSFADEVRECCADSLVIQALLDRFTIKEGAAFEEVPAFLE